MKDKFRLVRNDFNPNSLQASTRWDVKISYGPDHSGDWMSLTDDYGFADEQDAVRFLDRTLVNWGKPRIVTTVLVEI